MSSNMRQSSLKRYHDPYPSSRNLSEGRRSARPSGLMNKSLVSSPSKREQSIGKISVY
jgi:hypothetical protein